MFLLCLKGTQEKLWKLGKLNHVAIAVPDLGKTLLATSLIYQNNHLTPRSDQYINSSDNFNTLSSKQVMRIKRIINYLGSIVWI